MSPYSVLSTSPVNVLSYFHNLKTKRKRTSDSQEHHVAETHINRSEEGQRHGDCSENSTNAVTMGPSSFRLRSSEGLVNDSQAKDLTPVDDPTY